MADLFEAAGLNPETPTPLADRLPSAKGVSMRSSPRNPLSSATDTCTRHPK
jgi:hypothetical protein